MVAPFVRVWGGPIAVRGSNRPRRTRLRHDRDPLLSSSGWRTRQEPGRSANMQPGTRSVRLGTLEGARARARQAQLTWRVVGVVNKNDVRLMVVASAIMVGVPLIINTIEDLVAGRWDELVGRRRQTFPEHGEAALHLRGRPIEQLAADLRRLRVAVANDQQRSATHQLANRIAYDQLLLQACEMLNVPHDLGKNTAGPERDIERIRVEAELERAGMVLSPTGRHG